MTRLYLVRHGETIWNSQIRIQGHVDIPLSDEGRRQAHALASRMREQRLDAVYSSDLARAVETAEILVGQAIRPTLRAELREAAFGRWEGLTYEEVSLLYPDEQAARRERPAGVAPEGGELLPDTLARVAKAVGEIVLAHPEQSVLVVTHGGPLRLLLGSLLGLGLESYWKLRVDNCSLSIVDTYPEGAILSLLNDTCHLAEPPTGGDVP